VPQIFFFTPNKLLTDGLVYLINDPNFNLFLCARSSAG
jgi:hypothetical protein